MAVTLCSTSRSPGSLKSREHGSTRQRSPRLSCSCTAKASSTGLTQGAQITVTLANREQCLCAHKHIQRKSKIGFNYFSIFQLMNKKQKRITSIDPEIVGALQENNLSNIFFLGQNVRSLNYFLRCTLVLCILGKIFCLLTIPKIVFNQV